MRTESMRASGGVSELQSLQEDPNASQRPFDFNGDAVGVVADKAGKTLFICQAIDERTKADALDDPTDPDAYPLTRSIEHQTRVK